MMPKRKAEPRSRDSCCPNTAKKTSGPIECPSCKRPGKRLEEITVKALLRGQALARRSESEHRFCSTPTCLVVYYGRYETFSREDVSVRVFQKESCPERPVCYCFEVSEADILQEAARSGGSATSRRIRALIEADRCACELKNPQGSCCLGNVGMVERAVSAHAPLLKEQNSQPSRC
ncbi:MAG: (2Fe-2S)-binding protein [Acidobacteriota bacterium]